MSPLFLLVRELHSAMTERYPLAGDHQLIEHLAWEVGKAACGIVHPSQWVGKAMLVHGMIANRSEAQAQIALMFQKHIKSQELANAAPSCFDDLEIDDNLINLVIDGSKGSEQAYARVEEIRNQARQAAAIIALTEDLPALSLPVHARMEWCSPEERDEAAQAVLELAMGIGDKDLIEMSILSLLIFSADSPDWGGDGKNDPEDPAPRPAPTLIKA